MSSDMGTVEIIILVVAALLVLGLALGLVRWIRKILAR